MKLDLIDELHSPDVTSRLWKLLFDEWRQREPDSLSYESLRRAFHGKLEILRHGPKKKVFERDPEAYTDAEAKLLESIYSDPEEIVTGIWTFLRRSTPIAVFLDNADRADEHYQRELYAFAHRLASVTGVTVILPIRESTYWRAKEHGFLDVRNTDLVFHLQAPDPVQVLARRLRFAEGQLAENVDEPDHRLRVWRSASDWSTFREKALTYTRLLKSTFLTHERGAHLVGLLAAIAWHNIRDFLSLLYRLHADLGSDLEAPWLKEDILGSLALPGGDPSRRLSVGIFRPVAKRYHCYFLKLRIGLFLQRGVSPSGARRGTKYAHLVDFSRGYGYQKSWVRDAVTELVRERLRECLEMPTDPELTREYSIAEVHSYRLSPLGTVLLEDLLLERVVLACAGWELPFQDERCLRAFTAEADVFKSRSGCELDHS